MATNWSAYDAAKELYGTNKENIQDIGSRFPLFTRTVSLANSPYLLDLLKALPKVTARVVETGLKDLEADEVDEKEEQEEVKEEKKTAKKGAGKKSAAKAKKEEPEEDEADDDYESMSGKELYKLCCERGISGKCKERNKAYLIKVLRGEIGDEEPEEDDWGDDEEEEVKDPYAGKTARELYKMCSERGIKAKPKQTVDAYVKLLKKADAAAEEPEDEGDDDEWEI